MTLAFYSPILVLLIFCAGCSLPAQGRDHLYHVKYVENVENGILTGSELMMIPVFEDRKKEFTRIRVASSSVETPDLELGDTLWHNAIKMALSEVGTKAVHGRTDLLNNNIHDEILVSYEGYIVSPPKFSNVRYDAESNKAYGDFEFSFAQ